eukprot:5713847-Prymnesium_polylepis.1
MKNAVSGGLLFKGKMAAPLKDWNVSGLEHAQTVQYKELLQAHYIIEMVRRGRRDELVDEGKDAGRARVPLYDVTEEGLSHDNVKSLTFYTNLCKALHRRAGWIVSGMKD